MTAIGFIIFVIGALGLVLRLTGADAAILPEKLASIGTPIWIVVTVLGGALAMLTRRPPD